MEEGNKCIILLPGPPGELIPLFREHVFPYLFKKQPERIYSKMVKLCGIGESTAETMIQDLLKSQTNPTIAPYAKTGEVHLRITAKVTSKAQAKELMRPVLQELKKRFGKRLYTTKESIALEDNIVTLLKKKKLTLTTTESCTGGAVASRLINVSGISEVYKEGFVTYSNQAKNKYLNVKKATLKKHGAVSEQTAWEMAKGACKATGADIAIATTGIAGPDGGTKEKPVGLVYIACCVKGKVHVEKHEFNGNRSRIREQSVVAALTLLRSCII
jgi:nicotinamide-nucleotide amidase